MDLIQYLSQRKDKEGKLIVKKKGKKKKEKKERIPRRGRGYGQRHRAYRENKSKTNDTDTKILALLTTLLKQNQPAVDLSKPEALNPFIEKERQTYSMKFEPKIKTLEERLSQVEQKQLTMGEQEEPLKQLTMGEISSPPLSPSQSVKDVGSFIEGIETSYQDAEQKQIELATITNKLADYENKWTNIVETQESLKQELDDIPVGNMRDVAQENFRLQNLEIKEDVFSLQNQLQDDLNQAVDLNDYKDFIDFQKKVLKDSVNNFVAVDNRLAGELIQSKKKLGEEIEGFTQLQEETFQEKQQIQKANELLNVELEKSQQKEMEMMDELNAITNQYTKLEQKVYELETNPQSASSPPRVEVEEIELPKPKPTEEELKKQKEEEEALELARQQLARKREIQERKNKADTDLLINMVKTKATFSPTLKEAFKRLFGAEELEKIRKLGGGTAPPKLKRIKQLLQEKRGVEF